MSGKSLVVAGLLAVGAMLMTDNKASAQYAVRHGNHYHNVSPGYGYGGGHGGGYYGGGYGGGFYAPVYRPVYAVPVYGGYGYGGGYGYAQPYYGGYGYGSGYGYGGSFGTVNFGIYRPGFGANFGFVIR